MKPTSIRLLSNICRENIHLPGAFPSEEFRVEFPEDGDFNIPASVL